MIKHAILIHFRALELIINIIDNLYYSFNSRSILFY